MKQFANPTVCHRRNDDARFFAARTQPRRHVAPIRIVTNQAMCRFDQNDTEQFIAGLDEATSRCSAGTGIVTWTHRTKIRELLAGAKPIEASDQRTHRDRRDDTDAGLLQQLLDDGIIDHVGLHFFGDAADFFVEKVYRIIMIAYQVQRA